VSTRRDLLRAAWIVVALLWPVALLNYLDRQMLAAMKFSVMNDLPTIGSEANWGFLPAVFKWVYAGLSPVGGYLADRFNKRYVIVGSLFVWSAVTWATGHADTFNHLLLTRALMGISEAFYIPAALALIADHHPRETRSRAVGIHQMGIYCGVIIGGFSGYVADAPSLGWRMAFTTCGLLGVIYAIPLLFLLRDTPRDSQVRDGRLSPLAALRELCSSLPFLLLVACFTLPALSAWVVRDWMPAILKQQFAIGQGKAGVSATLYVQIGSIAGVILGGWLADRWTQRTVRGRIFVSALGISLLIPSLFGVGHASTLMAAVAFLALFGFGWGFFDCNNMPILSQIARPQLRATGYGIMNMVSISCGGFADWTFGALRDRHVPVNLIFAVYAGIALVSVGLMLLIHPRERPESGPGS
jgi:MFS family permease